MFGFLRQLFHRDVLTGPRPTRRPRLNVEPLEARATPAHVSFAPVVAFVGNPDPLPPVALVQFAPLVQLPNVPAPLGAPTSLVPVQIQGTDTQTLSPPTTTTPGWALNLSYRLGGSATESWIPASATQPPGFTASFSLTGQITETLYQTNPISSGWHIAANIRENGTVFLLPNLSQVNPVANLFGIKTAVTLTQTETAFYPPGALAPVSLPWLVQAHLTLGGTDRETSTPKPVATGNRLVAAFSLQDQITERLSQATTGTTPPTSGYAIVGQFSAVGSATVTLTPPATAGSAWEASGTVQDLGTMSETISGPSATAGTQTLTQAYESLGRFLNNEFDLGLVPLAAKVR